jgi:spore cortex formation protein SpoVR/YcgB (stage V sporulation)
MFKIPLQGFPHAQIISMMSQLPVRKGMKIAYENWKSDKKFVREKQYKANGE